VIVAAALPGLVSAMEVSAPLVLSKGTKKSGRLAEAMPALRKRLQGARNVIVESNSVLKFLRPDLYLTVLDPSTADFKNSAREFLDRASAVILHESSRGPAWQAVSLKPVADRPVFRITPPEYVTPEIVNFIRERITAPEVEAPKLTTGN